MTPDLKALKAICRAMDTISEPHMVRATLDFLNSKYGKQMTHAISPLTRLTTILTDDKPQPKTSCENKS